MSGQDYTNEMNEINDMNQWPVVLYVDDDAKSRKVLHMLLTKTMKLAYVTLFSESDDFEQRILALDPRPDVIFLDIHVKPLTGFEMLKIIRSLDAFKGKPVIALTASVMNEEVEMLRTAGFDGCFSKPVDLDTFPGNLQRVLNGERFWRIV